MIHSAKQLANRHYVYSRLCQRVVVDGIPLDIVIYRPNAGGGWQLNVIDAQSQATIWDTVFVTDWAAFAAFQARSSKDGVQTCVSNDNVVAFPHYGIRKL
jgi:hypothetical protein